MYLINFDGCPKSNILYAGNACLKKGIKFNNENWMIKYPQDTSKFVKVDIPFTTAQLTEYIGSHIFEILGIPAHETILGISTNEITNTQQLVVACKDFTDKNNILVDYEKIKNDYSGSLQEALINLHNSLSPYTGSAPQEYTLSIEELMVQFEENNIFKENPEIKNRFWQTFVVDCLINNNDRNKNNWGMLQNIETNTFKIAPVYDNGACFVSKHSDQKIKRMLSDKELFDNNVLNGRCFFTIDNKSFNYKKFINTLKEKKLHYDFNNALLEMYPKIKDKFETIKNFISEIPNEENGVEILSEVKKEFFIKSMETRIEELIKPNYETAIESTIEETNQLLESKNDLINTFVKSKDNKLNI